MEEEDEGEGEAAQGQKRKRKEEKEDPEAKKRAKTAKKAELTKLAASRVSLSRLRTSFFEETPSSARCLCMMSLITLCRFTLRSIALTLNFPCSLPLTTCDYSRLLEVQKVMLEPTPRTRPSQLPKRQRQLLMVCRTCCVSAPLLLATDDFLHF